MGSKSQMGKVSKVKLQSLNAQVRRATNYNQWRQTRDATRWFEGLPEPGRGKIFYFFQFDFKSFYGSIKETLFKKALQWATGLDGVVADDNLKLHLNAAKSFAYYGTKLYRARQDANNNPHPTNFNITMGSFDGAEVCELVGLYLLHKLIQRGIFERELVTYIETMA